MGGGPLRGKHQGTYKGMKMGNMTEGKKEIVLEKSEPKVVVQTAMNRIVRSYDVGSVHPTYYFEDARSNALDDTLHFVTIASFSTKPGEGLPESSTLVMPGALIVEMIRLIDGGHKELIQ